jgi:hypothetical protein
MTRGGFSILVAAAIVVLFASFRVEASVRFLLGEVDDVQSSGRFLLQTSSSLNCTRINPVSGKSL